MSCRIRDWNKNMKRILLLIACIFGLNYLFANEYEPEKLITETNDDVGMYFLGNVKKGLGVTAVSTNVMPGIIPDQDITISSANEMEFSFTEIKCTSMVQALDSNDKELAWMATLFDVKPNAIKKINKSVKDNKILFSKIIDSMNENDLRSNTYGTQNQPDPDEFSKLRSLNVYDFYVKVKKSGDIVRLQVYVENFQDAKEL